MAQSDVGGRIRRYVSLARGRLASARWVLVAATAAILAVGLAAGSRPYVMVIAMTGVFAVALVAPRRMRSVGRAGTANAGVGGDAQELSARELAAAVPDPVILFDRHGSVIHANAAANAAFGQITQGTLMPLKFRAPEMQQLIQSVLAGKPPAPIDYAERVPLERAFRVTAMPIGNRTGIFVILFRDQSETRRIDRMRADFIANASHELRTPLASIAGFIETLRGPARTDDKARDNFLQIMQTQTGRMARLIDDLLSLSRLEMKPYMRSDEKIDIAEVVGSVVESLGHLARENGLQVDFAKPVEPLLAPGSRDELIQVFENLLENACKYGQSGGRVEIRMARSDAAPVPEVSVTIRDFGPGIPEEHIPRITERFYRIDVETSRSQKGTGLGLAIVKHILTRHDGRLSVKSRLGEGASFTVHLPAAA